MTSPVFAVISYRVPDAVAATGVGESRIREAIRVGDLVAHYVGTKPVVTALDLFEWIESLPTEAAS